jgi:hypothetical protein
LRSEVMDNPTKRQSKRVNEAAVAPLAPGRDVLLALATAWSSSNGAHVGTVPAAATPPTAPSTLFGGVAAFARRTSR